MCVAVMSLLDIQFGGLVQDTAIWCPATRRAGQSTGAGLGKESGTEEEAGGS